MREVIRLEDLPLDVHSVSDGQQALEFLLRSEAQSDAPRPDILLLDLNLPKKDGFEVLRKVRASETLKAIPAVIFTSSNSAADRSRAAELGAAYFRKPPSYEEYLMLGSVLRRMLREKGLL